MLLKTNLNQCFLLINFAQIKNTIVKIKIYPFSVASDMIFRFLYVQGKLKGLGNLLVRIRENDIQIQVVYSIYSLISNSCILAPLYEFYSPDIQRLLDETAEAFQWIAVQPISLSNCLIPVNDSKNAVRYNSLTFVKSSVRTFLVGV